jgi:protein-L-isoaspartate(D-aspartate) O-methyltransferase
VVRRIEYGPLDLIARDTGALVSTVRWGGPLGQDAMTSTGTNTATTKTGTTDTALQRLNMVESQVRPSDVTDRRIIRAMGVVARDLFVPEAHRSVAYMDEAVSVGGGRRLLAPRLFSRLAQLAKLPDGGVVLDIGCATGYSTAVWSQFAKRVVGIDADATLVAAATANLTAAGASNATVLQAAHATGHAEGGPYDAICLNGSVPDVPRALLDQLKDGGILVAVVFDGPAGKAVAWRRTGTQFDRREAFDANASTLPGFERAAAFVF